MPQRALGLHEGEVCSAEDGLGLAESINLAGARLLADVKVLQQPIAVVVEGLDVLECGTQFLCGGGMVLCVLLEGGLHVSQSTLLVGKALRVAGAFVLRVSHHLLIVALSIFLLSLGNGHLFVKVLYQQVNHRDDTIALFSLLLVGTGGLWWWWGLGNAVL